jgi:hypothetical protein
MAKKPASVEIRAFQVGFGDCFLLSFVYSALDKRHVLIDFGTTELPGRGRPKKAAKASDHMPTIAAEIARLCGNQRLTAVVATHRHADHISGFGTETRTGKSGEIIKALRPKVVLQPWTEDPAAKRDATEATTGSARSRKSFVAGLAAMHDVARMVFELAEQRPTWLSAEMTRELRFLGMENIANESAVLNLIAMGKQKGAKAVWARHGSSSGLARLLPGVKVHVLGPPDLKQSEKIRKMRSTDPDEFWHLLAGASAAPGNPIAHGLGRRSAARGAMLPREARWFRDRLDRMRGEQLLEIVRTLDQQMNNTSVILLFEVFGKKLLFPGDAQLENWSYALEDAPDAKKTRALLADVDVYKVGHHGSLNATPKEMLWKGFSKRKGKLQTLLSTLPGKHGKTRNNTEVPRRPLLEILQAESTLFNTDDLTFGAKPVLCHTVMIEP